MKQNLPARIAAAASGVRASYLGWVLAALALLCVPCLGAEAQPPTPAGTKPGATAKPVRVALLTEEPSAAAALDLLTAELSKKDSLQLLERAEMERVYREQALAAGNKDYLKLGQVLGADGLLLFRPLKEGTNQYLQARLIAVKPGAIVAAVRSAWPVPDQVEWTKWLARYFEPSLPKLAVPAKDAVPLSVVNFRSALQSSDAQELERQFTLLTLERLSRQREVFVLERQRMELLTEEKELRGIPEDAFWNGSYLLEGDPGPGGLLKGESDTQRPAYPSPRWQARVARAFRQPHQSWGPLQRARLPRHCNLAPRRRRCGLESRRRS